MSQFKKGNTMGKGRPQGSRNKTTKEVREFFLNFMSENVHELTEAFKELSASEKFRVMLSISKFVIPTMTATNKEIDEVDFWAFTENN